MKEFQKNLKYHCISAINLYAKFGDWDELSSRNDEKWSPLDKLGMYISTLVTNSKDALIIKSDIDNLIKKELRSLYPPHLDWAKPTMDSPISPEILGIAKSRILDQLENIIIPKHRACFDERELVESKHLQPLQGPLRLLTQHWISFTQLEGKIKNAESKKAIAASQIEKVESEQKRSLFKIAEVEAKQKVVETKTESLEAKQDMVKAVTELQEAKKEAIEAKSVKLEAKLEQKEAEEDIDLLRCQEYSLKCELIEVAEVLNELVGLKYSGLTPDKISELCKKQVLLSPHLSDNQSDIDKFVKHELLPLAITPHILDLKKYQENLKKHFKLFFIGDEDYKAQLTNFLKKDLGYPESKFGTFAEDFVEELVNKPVPHWNGEKVSEWAEFVSTVALSLLEKFIKIIDQTNSEKPSPKSPASSSLSSNNYSTVLYDIDINESNSQLPISELA